MQSEENFAAILMAHAMGLKIQIAWGDDWCNVRIDCTEENLRHDHEHNHVFRVKPSE